MSDIDHAWAKHKAIIKQYWIVKNMKLERVAEIMKSKHGFDRRYAHLCKKNMATNVHEDQRDTKPSSANGEMNLARCERQPCGRI